jgi:alpha-mannosidase
MKRSSFVASAVAVVLAAPPRSAAAGGGRTVFATAYSHIDPAWRWPLQEGLQAADSTFRSVLRVLAARPHVIFSETSASLYDWVERTDPATFGLIRDAVVRGRWVPVGGWWTEADTNVPCGEALMRQGVYGQGYFQRAFGRRSEVGLLPDSFGSSLNLPAILRAQGLTAYLYGRGTFADGPQPAGIFDWAAPDGSSVKAYRAQVSAESEDLIAPVRAAGALANDSFLLIGLGDHGGGPTIEALKHLDDFLQTAGAPRFRMTTAGEFFAQAASSGIRRGGEMEGILPGSFTNNSRLKRSNFFAERALLDAERYDAMAFLLGSAPAGPLDCDDLWQTLLLNQHHDAISGTSLKSDIDTTIAQNRAVEQRARDVASPVLESMVDVLDCPAASGEQRFACFNPLPHAVDAPVYYPMNLYGSVSDDLEVQRANELLGANGQPIPFQLAHAGGKENWKAPDVVARVRIPAFGYTTLRLVLTSRAVEPLAPIERYDVANDLIGVRFDRSTGQPVAVVDLASGRDLLAEAARLGVYRDDSDTWGTPAITISREVEAGRFSLLKYELVEHGPVRQVARVTLAFEESTIVQDWILFRGERLLRTHLKADWRHVRRRLAFALPVRTVNGSASYDVPFARATRVLDENVHPANSNVSVQSESGHVALIGAGAYSYFASHDMIGLQLLRSCQFSAEGETRNLPSSLDDVQDAGPQELEFAILFHDGSLPELFRTSQAFAREFPTLSVGVKAGRAAAEASFGSCDPLSTLPSLRRHGAHVVARVVDVSGDRHESVVTLGAAGWRGDVGSFGITTLVAADGRLSPATEIL